MDIQEKGIEWFWLRKMRKSLEGWVWKIGGNQTFEEGWKGFWSQERTVGKVTKTLSYRMFTRSRSLIFYEWEVRSSGNWTNWWKIMLSDINEYDNIYDFFLQQMRKYSMSESSPRLKRCISVFAYVCGIFACENYGSVLGSIHNSPEPTL